MNPQEIAGAQKCMFGTSVENYCGRPAVLHVWKTDGTPTMSCVLHAGRWSICAHVDRHPICGECGLPDTRWIPSNAAGPGRCVIEGLDLPDLFATDAELEVTA